MRASTRLFGHGRAQRIATAVAVVALASAAGATGTNTTSGVGFASAAACSSGARTLSTFGARVYPDQGNGGYVSVHSDLHIVYDTAANLFLPGNHVDLTIRATQCLTDFSFDFERTAMSGSAAGPNMAVGAISIDGQPAAFDFRQPTYPGNPNGPDDPDPAAHAISNVNPVSATNPNPPACSPQTSSTAQNGLQCPANKLVVTPASPIADGQTITVRIDYTGRPGVHTDGDGSTEGWFRVNTAAAPNDGSFVTTEPVGSMAWMPLNNHPTAKPTYDIYDTVPVGKTAIGPGELVGAAPGALFAPVGPTQVNPPDANFPGGSWLWHWHAPEGIASYLVTNTIGSYDLVARTSVITGIQYYQGLASGLTQARKDTIRAVLNTQEDITQFQVPFNGAFPFSANGVIVALPSVGFAEEMQTKITFGNGASSTPSVGTFHHENMHQWFGDNVAEGGFNLTFWKEGWATVGEYLNTARNAAVTAGGLGTPAGDAAFDASLVGRFNTNYGTTSSSFWTSAPSNPTVGNLFSTSSTYTRPGTAYLALRQILGASASRPGSDRWIGVMKQIQRDFGGGSITEAQLENVFHQWLPNQSAGCHALLDQFFTQWFDTAYPAGGGANKPQLTGPGLNGPGFYDDAGACTRVEQTIDFAALAGRSPQAPDFDVTATSSSSLPVSFVAAGQCTISGATVHLTGPGSCTITASQAGTGVWKPAASVARTFAIHEPVVTSDAPPVQYSDSSLVTVSATDAASPGSALTASATGLPDGLSLALVSTSAAGTLPGVRTWAVLGIATVAPGSYPVSVTVGNDEGGTGIAEFAIVVEPEDAEATYTGDTIVGSTGTLLLRAIVLDSPDGEPGDIRKATVTFTEAGSVVCGPVDVVELVGGAPGTGTATCTASLPAGEHAIDVVVGGYYGGAGDGEIDVGTGDGRVSLVGYYAASNGSGTNRADDGSRTRVDLNVLYKGQVSGPKPKESLRGQVTVWFDSGGRSYRLDSDSLEALGVSFVDQSGAECVAKKQKSCIGLASLRVTATLTELTKRGHVVVATGLTLVVTGTDADQDLVGITVWSGNTLVLSSNWTGSATLERLLEHGRAVIK